MSQSFLKLYVDMDGVLADFDRRYDEVVGGRENRPHDDGGDSFWGPVLRTPYFWRDISPMSGCFTLWEAVFDHPHVSILTSPGKHDTERAMLEKRHWIDRHLGSRTPVIFCQSADKHRYACPNSLLIDDWSANIKRWTNAGGIGIKHSAVKTTVAGLLELGIGLHK